MKLTLLLPGLLIIILGAVITGYQTNIFSFMPNAPAACTTGYCVTFNPVQIPGTSQIVFQAQLGSGPWSGLTVATFDLGDANSVTGINTVSLSVNPPGFEYPYTYLSCGSFIVTLSIRDAASHTASASATVLLSSGCPKPINVYCNSAPLPCVASLSNLGVAGLLPLSIRNQGFQVVENLPGGGQFNCGQTFYTTGIAGGGVSINCPIFTWTAGDSIFAVTPTANFGQVVSNIMSFQGCSETGTLQITGSGTVSIAGTQINNGGTFSIGCNQNEALLATTGNFQDWSISNLASVSNSLSSATTITGGSTSGSFTLTAAFGATTTTTTSTTTPLCSELGTFNGQGGVVSVNGGSNLASQTLKLACGSQATVVFTPISGNAFRGWSLSGSATLVGSPTSNSVSVNVGSTNGGTFTLSGASTAKTTSTSSSSSISRTTITTTITEPGTTIISTQTRTTTVTQPGTTITQTLTESFTTTLPGRTTTIRTTITQATRTVTITTTINGQPTTITTTITGPESTVTQTQTLTLTQTTTINGIPTTITTTQTVTETGTGVPPIIALPSGLGWTILIVGIVLSILGFALPSGRKVR